MAVINHHEVAFSIEERQRQISKKENERAELAPTGQLNLVLRGAFNGHRENWRDGKRQRVEDFIGDFILEMESVAEARRVQAEEWRLARERREKLEQEKRQEKQNREQLRLLVERKRFEEDARSLITELKNSTHSDQFSDRWYKWATSYIDSIDPSINPVDVASEADIYGPY